MFDILPIMNSYNCHFVRRYLYLCANIILYQSPNVCFWSYYTICIVQSYEFYIKLGYLKDAKNSTFDWQILHIVPANPNTIINEIDTSRLKSTCFIVTFDHNCAIQMSYLYMSNKRKCRVRIHGKKVAVKSRPVWLIYNILTFVSIFVIFKIKNNKS